MMKKILGLDLGTNSIGWALIEQDFENKNGKILGMGSRIIPMSQEILGEFAKGNSISQTAERTKHRSVRRLRERHLLRRERLHRVLNIVGFLPEHYAAQIDFEKRLGQFRNETEPKIAYKNISNSNNGKNQFDFVFKTSFEEMLSEFKQHQPQLLKDKNGNPKRIPYDWTIYYLRKKALSQKIEKEELAWLILQFNQKRGYYQLRGEEEENPNKLVEFYSLTVKDVFIEENQKNKIDPWYSLILENGWVYRRSSKTPLFDWKNKVRDFIVTTDLNDDGSIKVDKEGNEKRSFRAPNEEDWTLRKKKSEQEIIASGKTVGTFIFDTLLADPNQKINGKLVRTIERKFYKEELKQILQKQKSYHPELEDNTLYYDCVRELYRNNESHQNILNTKDFTHLFVEDILFYQRPLRSQKSSISNCTLEYRNYLDANGQKCIRFLKAIPKSNPYYQEFRVWQWMYNLSLYSKEDNSNVTNEFLRSITDWENLFDFLNNRREIDQKALIKFLLEKTGLKGKLLNAEVDKYRWNYVEDKKYPCNETLALISARMEKVLNYREDFLSREILQKLWHIIYSVTDKVDYEKSLKSFATKHRLDIDSFVDSFRKFPPFKSEYGSYSEKAIKKLLPLMRLGKHWNWEAIDSDSKVRIDNILTGEYDECIKDQVREKAIHLTQENHFQGLQLWLAQYIVYGRHSEAALASKWNSAVDLENYLKEFKQHSLRNPIVEQVITETLRVVKDIWVKYGNGNKDYFDEIHIELGREMKKTKEERENDTKRITENENTNLRIKALLAEMNQDREIENVRPFSPMQQEILKLYEEGALNSAGEVEEDILKISKSAQPSTTELRRYKLWLEQKYRSPYTGEIIPLSRLFTTEYEIEHIIPQSRYFDDSLSNKVICEAAVNTLKDNQLGFEFIKNHHGTKVQLGNKVVQILEVEAYEDFINQHFAKNRGKRNKLLLEDIPDKMIERQINDTRYISKFISSLLSNIVREEKNDDGLNSKNVLPGNGKITNELKHDWGLNDIWNDLILPRFERMNSLSASSAFTSWNEKYQKFLPTVPLELSKGFSKKRIDHRHHAMDALVIACATRDHINLLNNRYAKSKERFDLNRKLRRFEKTAYNHPHTGERIEKEVPKDFLKPWTTFTSDARNALENIVVSFKQNLRVINKATNYYQGWEIKNGTSSKGIFEQKGTNWAIRKPMHKDTVSGKVQLPRIKVPKGKILTATRKNIDSSFNSKTIESITDTGIQKILNNYLAFKGNPELAFSPEGLEDLNKNIQQYNDGKPHQPIYKARIFELGSKFQLGQSGNKSSKYVEAAKGTNLFFAIYLDSAGKRNYETIPLNIVIERLKQGIPAVPQTNEKGHELLFHLSPGDIVYVPTEEELESMELVDFRNMNKVKKESFYKMVSSTGSECHFIPSNIASLIKTYDAKSKLGELGSLNKLEVTTTLENPSRIKEQCIKLTVDRLGNIRPFSTPMHHPPSENSPIVKEPPAVYNVTKKISIPESIEDAENSQLKYWADASPEQRFADFYKLMKRFYSFANPDWSSKKISFEP